MEGCLLDVCSALCVGAKSVAVTVTAQGTCSYRGTIGIFIVKFRDWAFVVLDHQSALANGVSHHQTALPGAGLRGFIPILVAPALPASAPGSAPHVPCTGVEASNRGMEQGAGIP